MIARHSIQAVGVRESASVLLTSAANVQLRLVIKTVVTQWWAALAYIIVTSNGPTDESFSLMDIHGKISLSKLRTPRGKKFIEVRSCSKPRNEIIATADDGPKQKITCQLSQQRDFIACLRLLLWSTVFCELRVGLWIHASRQPWYSYRLDCLHIS